MHKDLKKILISEEEIQAAAKRIAAQIDADYQGESVVFVGLLKGSVQFMADLLKHVETMCTIDFMCVSSYGSGTKSTGRVNIIKDLSEPIDDKNVVIVEDIIDSGLSMTHLLAEIKKLNPAEIRICSLLVKPGNLQVELDIPYCCFRIPNDFIVGYGLDYDRYGRGLRDIYVVTEG